MKIFVLWHAKGAREPELSGEQVGAGLQRLFAPLFREPATLRTRSGQGARLAWLELPVRGFRAPFFEEQDGAWALAPDYPLNARRLLRAHGLQANAAPVLPMLGR